MILAQDRRIDGPELGPNYLQILSSGDKKSDNKVHCTCNALCVDKLPTFCTKLFGKVPSDDKNLVLADSKVHVNVTLLCVDKLPTFCTKRILQVR